MSDMHEEVIEVWPRKANWVKITAIIPSELYIVWDEVVSLLAKQGVDHENELVRNGQILEVLSAEYLASGRRR